MNRKTRYPYKWIGLLTPLSVLLTMTMTLSTASLRASQSMTSDSLNRPTLRLIKDAPA